MKYGFGVDLGGTSVKIAYFDELGTMLDKWEIPTNTDNHGEHILADIAAAINGYIEHKHILKEELIGIGIGVPGPVDDNGTVNKCHNLGWGVFNVSQALSQLTALPVKTGNDANMAALGESWKGGAGNYRNVLLATFGTGVGGGIIINGKPVNGAHGSAGEIGHLVLEPKESALCSCGKRGCVEQYCSATGIVRLAKKRLAANDDVTSLREISPLTCKDVFDAGNAKDAVALEILEQVYDYMGQFLANVCCTVDPEVVVLGGGVSRAGQSLLDGAKRYFQQYAFPACKPTAFALATLGNDAGAYGAFKLILE